MTQAALFTHREPSPPQPADPPYEWIEKAGPRTLRQRRCPTCKQPILAGLDEDLGAFHTHVDPTPLTRLGEALTLLGNRRTYTLRRQPPTAATITRRGRWAIPSHPPGAGTSAAPYDVLPAHQCHAWPLPPEAYTEPTVHPSAALAAHPDDPAPY